MKLVCEKCNYVIRYYSPFEDGTTVYQLCNICKRDTKPHQPEADPVGITQIDDKPQIRQVYPEERKAHCKQIIQINNS